MKHVNYCHFCHYCHFLTYSSFWKKNYTFKVLYVYEIIFVNSKFLILMVVNNYNLSCESFQPHVSRRIKHSGQYTSQFFNVCFFFFDCIPELFSITSEIILNKHCQLICDQSSTIYTLVGIVLDVIASFCNNSFCFASD